MVIDNDHGFNCSSTGKGKGLQVANVVDNIFKFLSTIIN